MIVTWLLSLFNYLIILASLLLSDHIRIKGQSRTFEGDVRKGKKKGGGEGKESFSGEMLNKVAIVLFIQIIFEKIFSLNRDQIDTFSTKYFI